MKMTRKGREEKQWMLDDGTIYGAYLTPSKHWAAYRQRPGEKEEQLPLYNHVGDLAAMVYALEPQQTALF